MVNKKVVKKIKPAAAYVAAKSSSAKDVTTGHLKKGRDEADGDTLVTDAKEKKEGGTAKVTKAAAKKPRKPKKEFSEVVITCGHEQWLVDLLLWWVAWSGIQNLFGNQGSTQGTLQHTR
jgi:hypothetical protein